MSSRVAVPPVPISPIRAKTPEGIPSKQKKKKRVHSGDKAKSVFEFSITKHHASQIARYMASKPYEGTPKLLGMPEGLVPEILYHTGLLLPVEKIDGLPIHRSFHMAPLALLTDILGIPCAVSTIKQCAHSGIDIPPSHQRFPNGFNLFFTCKKLREEALNYFIGQNQFTISIQLEIHGLFFDSIIDQLNSTPPDQLRRLKKLCIDGAKPPEVSLSSWEPAPPEVSQKWSDAERKAAYAKRCEMEDNGPFQDWPEHENYIAEHDDFQAWAKIFKRLKDHGDPALQINIVFSKLWLSYDNRKEPKTNRHMEDLKQFCKFLEIQNMQHVSVMYPEYDDEVDPGDFHKRWHRSGRKYDHEVYQRRRAERKMLTFPQIH